MAPIHGSLRETQCRHPSNCRTAGSALVLALFGTILLAAFSAALVSVVGTNLRNSSYFSDRTVLRSYAQSCANMAIFELNNAPSVNAGRIGTANWTGDDTGMDGLAATGDLGENDGIPTFGEAGVVPVAVGPAPLGARALVWVEDDAWPGVRRVVAEAFTAEARAVVEVRIATTAGVSLPPGATFLDANVPIAQFDGDGLDGTDINLDGSAGSNPATHGLGTQPGSPAGSNAANLLSQISSGEYDTILGEGGSSSVGEASTFVDIDALFDALMALKTVEYIGGSPNNEYCGDAATPEITYFSGSKWTLSGSGQGAGILLVDAAELTMSGDGHFDGMIIARVTSKVTLSGGPNPHVYGQLMVTGKGGDYPDYKQSGGSKVQYSSQGLAYALQQITALGLNPGGGGGGGGGTHYAPVFWESR